MTSRRVLNDLSSTVAEGNEVLSSRDHRELRSGVRLP